MAEDVRAGDVGSANATPRSRRWRAGDWVFYSLLVLACLGLLYVASLPGSPLLWLTPVLLLWLAVGMVWLVRLITALQRRSLTPSLVIAPLAVVAMAALFLSPWPLEARFALSRSAFDHAVQSLPATQGEGGSLGMVGTYRISQWSRTADGVLFYSASGAGLVDQAGFAYSAEGVPKALTDSDDPGFEVMGWQDLGGGWYAWQASW